MRSRLNNEVFDILCPIWERALADPLSLSELQELYTARVFRNRVTSTAIRSCPRTMLVHIDLIFDFPKRTGDRSSLIPARSAESPHS